MAEAMDIGGQSWAQNTNRKSRFGVSVGCEGDLCQSGAPHSIKHSSSEHGENASRSGSRFVVT